MSRIGIGLLITVLGTVAIPVIAHHGGRGHFHFDQDLVIEDAVVSSFRIVNPHTYIYFDVVDESGAIAEWRCEMTAGSRLRRQGWTNDTFMPGQVITVIGYPAKREDNLCKANEFVLADGSRLTYVDLGLSVEPASESRTQARPEYLPNGQPNLGGPWSPPLHQGRRLGAGSSPGTGLGPALLPQADPQALAGGQPTLRPDLTEAGQLAAEGYMDEYDNPVLACHPVNIIFAFNVELTDFVQYDDRILLKHGFMDLERTIHLDKSGHPEQVEPSVGGHSIGWWEGDVLVVDTIGFQPGVLMSRQKVLHSDQLHVIERFEVRDDGRLYRSFVAKDPLYVVEPWTGEQAAVYTTELLEPYGCIPLEGKNNQRPATSAR